MEIQVMISQEQVLEKVKEMAQLLNERYHGEPVYLVGILKGSVFFMCDLAKPPRSYQHKSANPD